jgi:TPR repeat protein
MQVENAAYEPMVAPFPRSRPSSHLRTSSGASTSSNNGLPIARYSPSSYPPNSFSPDLVNPSQSHHNSVDHNSPLVAHNVLVTNTHHNDTVSQPPPRPQSASRRFIRPMSSTSSVSSLNVVGGIPLPVTPDLESPPMGPLGPGTGLHSHRASTASLSLSETASQYASASMFDLSQSYIAPHFGPKTSSLMPRIKTIELYRKNAKKSNDPLIQFQFAQYMLQTALLSGGPQQVTGTPQDPNPPMSSASSSSSSSLGIPVMPDGTNVRNSVHSGRSTEEEKRIKHDLLKESLTILRKLAEKGFADAQYLLGDVYSSGALGKPDLRSSFSMFQLAAKHGHGEAAYRAALCLEQGWGTSKDVKRAVQFLRMAASRNQPGAMLRLGMACFYGRMGIATTSPVKQEGIKWLKLAANTANEVFPQAPYELAKIVQKGYLDIVIPDENWAVQLYVKSAELNYVPAARVLGQAYELGELACPKDAALSIHYYTIGVTGGDAVSMLAMCAWYLMGAEPILQPNQEEAFEWALRAAKLGYPKAQCAVAYFLEKGCGCDRDISQAAYWYEVAAKNGDPQAIARVKKASGGLNGKNKNKKDKDCIIS